jgi:Ca2+-binding EF-hand superfamily protein
MTMEQFKAKGGALTGREERYDEFEGVPKNIGGAGGIGAAAGLTHKTVGSHGHEHARHGDYDATPNHHSDAGLRQGGLTHNSTSTGTHNPLDRNNDGKVSAKDLTGSHSNTTSTGTHNPLDRNNDGKVSAGDLTGSHSNTSHTDRGMAGQGNLTGSSTQGGIVGSGVGDRNHDGKIDSHDLKDPARSGNHGATGQHKPSLMDKLNPKVDADGDGKAGFMK